MTKNNYLTYSENLWQKFDVYYTSISTVYTNNYIQNIKSLNEDLKNNIDNIIKFEPNNTHQEDEISKDLYDNKYVNFYNSIDFNANKRKIETNLKCNFCNGDNVFYYCQHCNFIFCEKCGQSIIYIKIGQNPGLYEIQY